MLLTASFGFAQAPTTDPTTPPARDAGDVISIYSDAYDNIANVDYNPNWGQSGFASANVAYDTGSGNTVLAYPNFNYQGNDFNGAYDISSMEFLHLDLWTVGGVNPNVFVISGGGEVANPVPAGSDGVWRSIDIPVANITLNLDNAFQFKFDGGNGSTHAIYIDNLYFWRSAVNPAMDANLSDLQVDGMTVAGFGSGITTYNVDTTSGAPVPTVTATTNNASASTDITQASAIPGTATVVVTSQDMSTTKTYTVNFVVSGPPNAAPTPPNRPAADVKSIFSDAYAQIAVDTYDTSWCPATTTTVMVGGNATKKVTGLGCEGVEFVTGRFDATSFSRFHMDIYTDSPTMDKSFNIKFSNWDNTGGEVNALEFSFTNGSTPALPSTNPGTWISIDIPFTAWTPINGASRNDFVQFVISSDLGTVYYDNLYLHKNTLGVNEFDTASFNVFPNPSKDSWTLKTTDITMSSIQVFDMVGKNVMSLTPNASETVIDGSNLKTGLYFARITTNGNVNTVKLIKN